MKNNILLIAAFLLAFINSYSQSKFTRSITTRTQEIYWKDVKQVDDGGYILLASARDTGFFTNSMTILLVRLNANGDTLWTNEILPINGNEFYPEFVEEVSDGFVISVSTKALGTFDLMLVKTDTAGNFIWSKTYGGAYSDGVNSIKKTSDDGLIICANEAPDYKVTILKVNNFGDTVWTRNLAYQYLLGNYAFETSDGSIVVIGNLDHSEGFVSKLSPTGDLEWSRIVSFDIWHGLVANDAIETNDGGLIITSIPSATNQTNISVICKLDSSGNLEFSKRILPGSDNFDDLNICELNDGKIKLIYSMAYPPYFLLEVLLDSAGNALDFKSLPIISTFWMNLDFTSDKEVICTEYTGNIYKIDSSFNAECISSMLYSGISEDTSSISVLNLAVGFNENWTITNPVLNQDKNVSFRVDAPCMPDVSICLVTVDPATQKNLVVWEKNTDTTFVESYKIYKESPSAGEYGFIGTVPVSQFSTFLDSASNPAVQAERYSISPFWHGYEKELTANHKTIHLTINLGQPPNINLMWSDYEGFSYSTYVIWRGTAAGVSIIATLPFGTNSYTDLAPPANDSLYFVEIVHPPCNPSFRLSGLDAGSGSNHFSSITSILSNIVSKGSLIGVNELNRAAGWLGVFPNPNTGTFQITLPDELVHEQNLSLSIYNSLGRIIREEKFPVFDDKIKVNLENEAKGIYSAVLTNKTKIYIGRILVE